MICCNETLKQESLRFLFSLDTCTVYGVCVCMCVCVCVCVCVCGAYRGVCCESDETLKQFFN